MNEGLSGTINAVVGALSATSNKLSFLNVKIDSKQNILNQNNKLNAEYISGNINPDQIYLSGLFGKYQGYNILTPRSTIQGRFKGSPIPSAYGQFIHMEGSTTAAYGKYSHAEGYGTYAYSQQSHAEGLSTRAGVQGIITVDDGPSGNAAHSEGYETYALGAYSHTEGYGNRAFGQNSHSEGRGNYAYTEGSHAEGAFTQNYGQYSHTEGYNTKTQLSGIYGHAEGQSTIVSGKCGHAEGLWTNALGTASHAQGQNTIAKGYASHAEGTQTETYGDNSHAEGALSIVSGNQSHAEGLGTIALENSQHIEGVYNQPLTGYQHIVGSGTSNNDRKNIQTLDWNGNQWNAGIISASDFITNDGINKLSEKANKVISGRADEILLADISGNPKITGKTIGGVQFTLLSGNDIIVSGAGAAAANGTYTIMDSTKTGYDRKWTNGTYYLTGYKGDISQMQYNMWNIKLTIDGTPTYNAFHENDTDPWDTTLSWSAYGDEPAPTSIKQKQLTMEEQYSQNIVATEKGVVSTICDLGYLNNEYNIIDTNQTLQNGKRYLCQNPSGLILNLPKGQNKKFIEIVTLDLIQNCSIKIYPTLSATISGDTSLDMDVGNSSLKLVYEQTSNNWIIINPYIVPTTGSTNSSDEIQELKNTINNLIVQVNQLSGMITQ